MIETVHAIIAVWIASGIAGAISVIDRENYKGYGEFKLDSLWFFGTGLFLGPFIFLIEINHYWDKN